MQRQTIPIAMKNKIQIAKSTESTTKMMSVPRSKENGCFTYITMTTDLIRPICFLLLDGAYLDKMTTLLNPKLLRLIIEECKNSLIENPQLYQKQCGGNQVLSICKIVPDNSDCKDNCACCNNDEDKTSSDSDDDDNVCELHNVLKINTLRLMTSIYDAKLSVSIPFHFLDGDVESKSVDKERAIQLDIHERILFQAFQLWDTISQVDREYIILKMHKCDYPHALESDVQYIKQMAFYSKEMLFTLLARARGHYMKNNPVDGHTEHTSNSVIKNFKSRTMPNQAMSPFYVPNPCICADGYMLSRLYKRFDDTITQKKTCMDSLSPYDVDTFIDCEKMTGMLIESLFFLWNGVVNLPLLDENKKVLKTNKFNLIVDFKVRATDHSLIKKLADPHDIGDKKVTSMFLLCNHKAIREHIFKIFYYSDTYGSNDNYIDHNKLLAVLRPYLEDNYFTLIDPEEKLMAHRLTELENVYTMALTDSQYTQELCRFFDMNFPAVSNLNSIRDKTKWIMFEMIYRRNVDVFPCLSRQRVPRNPLTDRFNFTFGYVSEDDIRWKDNNALIETFINDCFQCNRLFRERTLKTIERDFYYEESKKQKHQAKKAKTKAKKKAKLNKMKNEQQQQQQQQQQLQEETEEEEEDEEQETEQEEKQEEEIEEEEDEEEEDEDRYIDKLINEATFYYLQ